MQCLPALCSHLICSRFGGSGAERKIVSYDALVAGYERLAVPTHRAGRTTMPAAFR